MTKYRIHCFKKTPNSNIKNSTSFCAISEYDNRTLKKKNNGCCLLFVLCTLL